jgi:hypothetical protein
MTATEPKETNTPKRAIIWPILQRLPSVAFFVLFYLYLTFEIDLRFLYNGGGLIDNFPTFYRGWDFLLGHLTYPGGLVEYASAFLAQLFYYSWAGAAVVTCQAWLIGLATDVYLKVLGVPRLRVLRFVGPLVLVAIYSQYTFHFPMTLAFTVVLMAVCLFLSFAPKGMVWRGVTFLILSIILYACAGGAYLLFALLCGGAQIVSRRRYSEGVLYGLSAAVIPYLLGVVIWGQRVLDAYSELLPLSLEALENEPSKLMLKAGWIIYLFLPLTIGGVGLWRLFFGRGEMPSPEAE